MMFKRKKILKIFLSIFLMVLLSGTVFIYKFMCGTPFTLNQLYLRSTLKILKDDPETLSQLGLLDNTIFDFFSDDLTDASPEEEKNKYKIYNNDLKVLKTYNTTNLNSEEKLSYDVFQRYLQNEIDGEKFMFHNYPVNQIDGAQTQLLELMTEQKVTDKKSAKNFIERLSKFNSKFDGIIEGLKVREKKGIIPPKFILNKVIDEIKGFTAPTPKNNELMTSFIGKLDSAKGINSQDKKELIDKAEKEMKNSVYPAYKKLLAYIEELEKKSNDDAGVWKLPDGDKYYEYKLKSYTTTDLTPSQIHDIGLKEVARIENEMSTIIKDLGYNHITPGDFMKKLSTDSRFKYSNDASAKAAIIQDYTNTIKEIDKNVSNCFDIRPKGKVEVKPVPEFKQATSEAAYTMPTNKDGSRPTTLYINLSKTEDIMKYNIYSMAAHETIPGHHIQRGIQRQLKGVPTFRTALPFTSFAEGWAMYAENLAWEKNNSKNPYDNLGRLQFELWRSVRLVVDTGMHYKKWTREQAMEYMLKKTGMAEKTVENEIDRYIVDPGQACAYKIGMLKFMELRQKSEHELGEKFDIKEYHNTVLKNGAMPLYMLEEQVNKYISNTKNK